MTGLRIGVCGGGVGGLAAAIAFRMLGHNPVVFEQAPQFLRVGADVNLTPNAVHALDRLGVGEILRETAAHPTHRISRMWDTGEETSRLPMSKAAEEKYGAPQLTKELTDDPRHSERTSTLRLIPELGSRRGFAIFEGLFTELALVVLSFVGLQPAHRDSSLIGGLLLAGSAGGVAVSAYLTYLEAFVINAWCQYCVVSAVLITLIFFASLPEIGRLRKRA